MFSLFRRRRKKQQRFNERQEIEQFLTVYDEDKFVLLGRVDDLSMGGMCVLSEMEIPINKTVKLAIEIPGLGNDPQTIFQRCESVWQYADEKNGLNKIGFRFVGISAANMKIINDIITKQPGLAGSTSVSPDSKNK